MSGEQQPGAEGKTASVLSKGENGLKTDIIVIGAGVTGCAVARMLSRYEADVTVLERGCDCAEGASKANSGIVHAGFDAVPGTKKALYNVRGAEMYEALTGELGVPYRRNGALVVAFSEEERPVLRELLEQGEKNGVKELRIVEKDELHALEPNLNPEAVCALYAPTSGLVSPYEMTYALADHAAVNGVRFVFDTNVTGLRREDGLWHVATDNGEWEARAVVNCAGCGADTLHNAICAAGEEIHIIPRRGQYDILDHPDAEPFARTMFQCPSKMGKGILVAPTVHRNVLLGPTAEDIDDERDNSTTAEGLSEVSRVAARTWPAISLRTVITNFSGVRAHEAKGDFVIGAVPGAEMAWEAAGIESPGLSAAPAIGEALAEMIAEGMGLGKKAEWKPAPAHPKPFNEMNEAERAAAVAADPENGHIICRCEVVTEAEIRAAIRRPVGAKTIDGVKRRTRAGMGRCQGGFCSPRVAEILAEELREPLTAVTKDGHGSELLVGTVHSAMEEAAQA